MNVKNVGSIGGITPFFDNVNYRIKGWISEDGVVSILDNDEPIEENMIRCQEFAKKEGATRISLRALVKKDLRVRNEEARIPVDSNIDLVYIGKNSDSRRNNENVVEEEKRILTGLLSKVELSENPLERVSKYEIELLREFDGRDIRDIKNLFKNTYNRDGRTVMWYEPTEKNIKEVLGNSVVAVARNSGKIVSLSAAEKATIPTSKGNLELYEVSDAATLENHKRRGLLQACAYTSLSYIFSNHPDIVYSESRACNIGATKSFLRVGFKYGGFLPKHVKIGGARDVNGIQGDIEDLNLLYKEVKR